jgi:D-arabinose 1-dehydrogenase-like Zn-dependent alcohol dehydrogenase
MSAIMSPAMSDAEAAPLLCAGVTVLSPLQRHVTRPGMRLGVIGLGGLGHLAVQFGKALGCEVTAFDPDAGKAAEAKARESTRNFVKNHCERGSLCRIVPPVS